VQFRMTLIETMEITQATKADIDGILAIQSQIYRIDTLPKNAAEILSDLIESDNCTVIVAKENGTVLSSALLFYLLIPAHGKPYALLEGMVVDKNIRGKGVGTALMKKIIAVAGEKGCYKINFTSGKDRADTHKFYENLGFKKWGLEFRMDLK